jgi:hypothetical protein
MPRIPDDRRKRMIAPARTALDRLRRSGLTAVIPISREGWQSAVADAGVAKGILRVATALTMCTESGLASSPKAMQAAVRGTVDSLVTIAEDLWYLDAFDASGGRGITLLNTLIDACTIGIDVAAGFAEALEMQGRWSVVEGLVAEVLAVEKQYPFVEDPCEAAFGVPFDSVRDAKGIFSGPRLLGQYYGHYSQLQRRLNSILSIITSSPPDLLNALRPAEALVLTQRPLVALRTALRTKNLLGSKLAEDAEKLAQPLNALKSEIDRSATSHAGMVRVAQQLESAETSSERATLTLDLYRRMVEGQLRPWAWTLLRILGRPDGKAPELASLREQLLAERAPLLRDAAEAILPSPRNAAAHEDYTWDDNRKVLQVGDTTISIDDLEAAISRAYAFIAGAECAWRCMRTESSELARLLDNDKAPQELRIIGQMIAVEHFGTNGLSVHKWTVDGDVFSVVVDDLPLSSVNPCFQAVMWASRHLVNTRRFVVKIAGHSRPAMDLGRQPLDACFTVWREAVAHFSAMPQSTFLPANAWARLAVELPHHAVQAISWLALNDAQHAYLDAGEMSGPVPERIAALNSRLHLIATALTATVTTLPIEMMEPLEEVHEVITAAVRWNLPATIGLSSGPAIDSLIQIRDLCMSYPVPAVLPTVDARPLNVVEAEDASRDRS